MRDDYKASRHLKDTLNFLIFFNIRITIKITIKTHNNYIFIIVIVKFIIYNI